VYILNLNVEVLFGLVLEVMVNDQVLLLKGLEALRP
jgi:hypothetical protein